MTVGPKSFGPSAMRKLLGVAICALVFMPVFAHAQIDSTSTGLEQTGVNVYGTAAETNITSFIGLYILRPALGFVGVIFLLLMIYAGFLWMTAGGNTTQVEKAKNILVSTIIGTVLIVSAYVITTTVFNALSGQSASQQQSGQTP